MLQVSINLHYAPVLLFLRNANLATDINFIPLYKAQVKAPIQILLFQNNVIKQITNFCQISILG